MKPHEEAPHIASLLQVGSMATPEVQMSVVRRVLDRMTKALGFGVVDVNAAHTVAWEAFTNNMAPPKQQAIGELAWICVQAIERGHLIDRDRVHIPLLYAASVGYLPDRQSKAGKNKRPARKPYLLEHVITVLKANPNDDSNEIAQRLEGDGIVTNLDETHITYYDEAKEKAKVKYTGTTITFGAFRNIITRAKAEMKG